MMDQAGRLAGWARSPGNAHGLHSLLALLEGVPANALIAGQAYDTDATLALLDARNIAAAIPSRANRKAPRQYDPGV